MIKYIIIILLIINSIMIFMSLMKNNNIQIPKYEHHYNKIDSLNQSVQDNLKEIKELEIKIDSLTKIRIKSQNIYNTYKIISNEKLKNLPDHSNASIDSLRKLLTN